MKKNAICFCFTVAFCAIGILISKWLNADVGEVALGFSAYLLACNIIGE